VTGHPRLLLSRVLQVLPVVVVLLFITVLLQSVIPGDPARAIAGLRASDAQVERVRQDLGLDDPVPVQFGHYVHGAVRGDLGRSNRSGTPVTTIVRERASVTLYLAVGGLIVSLLIALPAALWMALRPQSVVSGAIGHGLTLALNCPPFWVGLMLASTIALRTGWFPVGGFGDGFTEHLRAIVLPSLTIGLAVAPLLARSAAASLRQVLTADHVTTARSLGITGWPLVRRHLLRNATPPAITLLAFQASALLFGAVVVEQTFGLHGLGSALISAAAERDFPVVQGLTLVFGLTVISINLLADLAVAILDPRTTWR
jgi:peptide/nickel transport system permease protein